jgi:two-component system, chemotaxis family, protein-glutamate methylesterase/glutaminase
MPAHEHAVGDATGFTCPRCGGALWRSDDLGNLQFACRIGDAFSAAELWIEHCALRNRALQRAMRVLAENAALARALQAWAQERGDRTAVTRIGEEAADDERVRDAIGGLLEGLSASPPLLEQAQDA